MTEIARLLDAIVFAASQHKDQRRKDARATPYINHPLAVARMLACDGEIDDVEILMAAILHDTVEDTDTTLVDLRSRFGERVASIVAEVTDDKALSQTARKLHQIQSAPYITSEAALVKLADKTCNLRDVANAPPDDWTMQRRLAYFDWARRVVGALPPVNSEVRRQFDAAFAHRPRIEKDAIGQVR